MPTFLTENLSTPENYKLLISSVMPRPIALVSTLNKDETVNLAPYSSFNLVASNPASICFSIVCKPDGTKKDTLINIESNKEFVINSAHTSMLKQVALAGADFKYGESEISACNFTLTNSTKIKTPGIKESLLRLECIFENSLQVGDGTAGSAKIIVGRILAFHFDDQIFENGKVKFDKLDMLSRLGGFWYSSLGQLFEEKVPNPLEPTTQKV
jgi:flavin reductase (DIM6/NTAB) family NADH-FMN oxidoreductase RutF